jgi:hypothetical protein
MNSYVAYVFRRVLNSRYTKFGLNRLRGQRINLEHTNRQTFAFIYIEEEDRFKALLFTVIWTSFDRGGL